MFENVDVSSLRNALNACKNNIRYNESKEIIGVLNGNAIWEASSKYTFLKYLENQVNNNYPALEKKIDAYLKVVDLIEQYQLLKIENDKMNGEINALKASLSLGDNDGSIQNKINILSKNVAQNTEIMESLTNQIANNI